MSKTSVKICTCDHAYQDRIYGRKKRLHNSCFSKAGKAIYRCTVCCSQKEGEKKETKSKEDKKEK